MDIHNYQRRFERTLERIKESEDILEENKEIILDFKNHLLSDNIGVAKIERYLTDMMKYSMMLNKPFNQATETDTRRIIAELNQKPLAEETKKAFKIMLRKLYRFIHRINKKGVYPSEVEWISINIPNNHKKLPEELLTEEEVSKIVQNCNNLRDKTLIFTIYESGCRVGEIGSMKIKHVSFEKYGARLTVKGKTGMRTILVINSAPYLQQWINQHPKNNDSDSYLWYSSQTDFLTYKRISDILKKASREAGIKKRVYLHLLRHSRATSLANKMSEASMKQYFGWTQGSKMASVYIHMSGKDTDEAILEASGIKLEKETIKPIMQPKKCLKCNEKNEATNRFCRICGFPLDKDVAQEIIKKETERSLADDIMNKLIKDPEILEIINRKISDFS